MFDLAKSSFFFETMEAEHPTLVQNIDIVNENRRSLDATYHQPKHFILSLNNLLRSLLFFMEYSVKNSPAWLKNAVSSFKNAQKNEYEILKYLRNVSAHQKLIFPDESLVSGLFRIKSSNNYLLKLGLGDHNKPGFYSKDLALKNTEDIFDEMLTFSSIAFMDLEHSALGECLGVTRRWFYKVNLKTDDKKISDVVDVYTIASNFSSSLLDHVCSCYAIHQGVPHENRFSRTLAEHNHINTLLEIDLYPSLFSKWWEDEFEPLNYGVRIAKYEGNRHLVCDEYYSWIYQNLTPDAQSYRASLDRFSGLTPDAIADEANIGDFLSFVTVNHWHFKNAFPASFFDSPVSPSDVMLLQRFGKIFLEEYKTKKLCTIDAAKKQLDAQLQKIAMALAG
jgi:hypothetical protein